MLNTVFYSILNMSITSALIGMLVVILRKMKLIPRMGIYWLWTLVLLKLLIPFSISSPISLMNIAGVFIKKVVAVPGAQASKMPLSMTNSIGAAETYFPVTYKSEQLEKLFEIAAFIWIIGAISSLMVVFILYYMANSQLSKVRPVKNNIYTGDMVEAPLVHGIWRQRILVPEKYLDSPRLKYVVMHENIHIKRHDNLLRVFAVLTACIHWFNPLVWIFLKLFTDDMELTCDLHAVKNMPSEERKLYAGTLLEFGAGQKILMSAAFGKANVKVRVLNVLSYRKLSLLALIVTMIFVAVLSAILLTNPVG